MKSLQIFSLKNFANIYTLLWISYYMQGTLYTSGGPVGIGILTVFLLISMYYFIIVNRFTDIPKYLRGLNLIFILIAIYGVIHILDSSVIIRNDGVKQNSITYLKTYCISILPIYAYYFFAKSGHIGTDWIRKWTYIFVAFAIFQYYNTEASTYNNLTQQGIDVEIITNNMGYYFVSLICLIPFFNRWTILQYILLAICGYFVISSAKRGAILCYSISAIIFLWNNLRKSSASKKSLVFALGLLCTWGAYLYIQFMIDTNISFASRFILDSNNTSGRNDLYQGFINQIKNESNIFYLIFGHGADGTIALMGNFAHNDWLEFAIDMGVLGIVAYFYYYMNFVRTLRESKCFMIKTPLLLLIIPCFLKSIYSMSIGDFQVYESAVLAVCLAHLDNTEIL